MDNIGTVISDGNLYEAGFKVMQLSAQTRTAGKIILDALQEKIAGPAPGSNSALKSSESENASGIILLRYLSCQKKFAILLDLCDECGTSIQNALKGNLGTIAAQIQSSATVNETKSAYDDFLAEIKAIEGLI